ncbi:hypothetical protein [Azospirillum sp. B510]|uniref:hypothetical protein n=1 Tax=Azospirillum sp. (strain B510) TaxID=137722 RepID=UPI0005A9FA9F|nr:hypothetical protein [Azospirillum sp. B510]
MDIPDMGRTKFISLSQCDEALAYSFDAKRAALGPYVAERWGWNDDHQFREHRRRFEETDIHWLMERMPARSDI